MLGDVWAANPRPSALRKIETPRIRNNATKRLLRVLFFISPPFLNRLLHFRVFYALLLDKKVSGKFKAIMPDFPSPVNMPFCLAIPQF